MSTRHPRRPPRQPTRRPIVGLLVGALGVALLALTGCGGGNDAASGSCEPIALAFMGPLTGADGALGRFSRNGAEVAVREYNLRHEDCPVGLVSYDSLGSPDNAPNLADTIVADPQNVGVVGPTFSGETLASMPIFEAAGMPVVTGSATNPTISQQGWRHFHRAVGNDATQGPAAAAYMVQRLGVKRVAVIDDNSAYGKSIADLTAKSLQNQRVDVAVRVTVDPDSVDYRTTVQAVRDAGVDAVYFGGVTSPGGRLVRQLRDAGITAPFVGGDGLYGSDFVDYSGGASVGAIVTCPCLNAEQPSTPRQIAFSSRFKQIYGQRASYFATEYYDAALLFLDGIEQGHRTRASLEEWLDGVDVKGVTKQISFDRTGEVKGGPVYVFEVTPTGSYNQVAEIIDGKVSQ